MSTLGSDVRGSRGAGCVPPGLLEDADLVLAAALISRETLDEVRPFLRPEDVEVVDPLRALLFRIAGEEWGEGRPPTPTAVAEIARLRHGIRGDVGPLLCNCYRALIPYELEVARGAALRIAAFGALFRAKQAAECLDPPGLACRPDEAARALGDLARTAEEASRLLTGGGAARERDAVRDLADAILRLVEERLLPKVREETVRSPGCTEQKGIGAEGLVAETASAVERVRDRLVADGRR